MADGFWGFAIIGGPILLGLAIIWAALRNRTSRRMDRHTEQATHDLYQQQDREDQAPR